MDTYSFAASKFLRYSALTGWLIIIIWLSLVPKPPVPETKIFGLDKLFHAAAYGCLTFNGGWALAGFSPLKRGRWAIVAGAAVFIGGVMELLQKAFTETRTAEIWDFLANAFGAGSVLLGVLLIDEYKRRHSGHVGNSPKDG
jgi:VanZ family protein